MKNLIKIIGITFILILTSLSPALAQEDPSTQEGPSLRYTSHVEESGWQDYVTSPETSGTIGECRRLESIKIDASDYINQVEDGGISYRTQVSELGWLDWVGNDQESGTTYQSLAIEAIQIQFEGSLAEMYDIYYRIHTENFGWLDWAENGEAAGTEGVNLRAEAIEILVLPKGTEAPGSTVNKYYSRQQLEEAANAEVSSYVENQGWIGTVEKGEVSGTEGLNEGIEALEMDVPTMPQDSGINYKVQVEDYGWLDTCSSTQVAGTINENKQIETVAIALTGLAGSIYDVYYQVHSENLGWLGWAKNGELAGTTDGNLKVEALRVIVSLKDDPAPGELKDSFIKIEPEPEESNEYQYTPEDVDDFNLICAIVQHEGGADYESALAVMSCVMNRVESGRWGGSDPVAVLTAPGQFESYFAGYYRQFLSNPDPEVQRAVIDCLNGARSHPYYSFRSYPTAGSVNIGGNWYF